jgi:hypothetical protein
MTKQETAGQIVAQLLEVLQDNKCIGTKVRQIGKTEVERSPNIPDSVIDTLHIVAAESLEEFMGYVAKGTQRNG